MSVVDTVNTTAQTVQDWYLSALKTGDEALGEAARSLAHALSPLTSRVVAPLPEVRPVVDNWFSFAEKVLAEQKRFSLDLVSDLEGFAPAAPHAGRAGASKAA